MWLVAVAFSAGAAMALGSPALAPAATAVATAGAIAGLASRRSLLVAACASFAWTQLLAGGRLGSAWPCARDREAITVTGRVAAPALERGDRTDFDLYVIRPQSGQHWPRRIRVSWYEATQHPKAGETWRLDLRLRCRHGFVNPCAPDRDLALLREGIDATAYVAGKTEPARLAPPTGRPIERLRGRIADAIADAVPAGASRGVLQGLSVGVRGAIPDRLWDAFSVTGVAHLIAISGLHVTGCAVAALALLRLFARFGIGGRLRARIGMESAVVIAVTTAYTVLSGGSLPALRTLAMVAIFGGLRVLRRSWPLHETLGLTALVLVAGDPLALTSAGFWLSFVATAALCAAAVSTVGWRSRLIGFARAQLAVTSLLTPVLAATFGRISLVSPLVNAVAIPAFSVVVLPAVLTGTALTAASSEAAAWLWRALAGLLDRAWPGLEAISDWPLASHAPAAQPAFLIGAVTFGFFAALLLPLGGVRCAAASVGGALLLGGAARPAEGAFTLTALDVGQGLAAVVETARHTLVFDTGPRWPAGGAAADVSLLPYLRGRGIAVVDRLIVSHDDADHAGGIDALRRSLQLGSVTTSAGSRIRGDATCLRGDAWRWDGVQFRVLHPPRGFEGSDNDRSCAIAVSGPGGSALLLADPEAAAESELLGQVVAADVVLVPHHGSRTSSAAGLVAAASARIAIVSAGFGNRWGMPDPGVVARWREAGATVLATSDDGAIHAEFTPRPGGIAVTAERRDSPRWWRPAARD